MTASSSSAAEDFTPTLLPAEEERGMAMELLDALVLRAWEEVELEREFAVASKVLVLAVRTGGVLMWLPLSGASGEVLFLSIIGRYQDEWMWLPGLRKDILLELFVTFNSLSDCLCLVDRSLNDSLDSEIDSMSSAVMVD